MSAHVDTFTVVIADDDDNVRAALADLLGDHVGFELVGEASDGHTAAEVCSRLTPDLAVVDVVMPSGGSAAASAIHAVSPGTAVLAYTARGDHRTRDNLLRGGIEAVFVKGRTQDLSTCLYEHMQQRHAVR